MEQQIREALAALRRGGLVAYPTDTVYGLGCDARDPQAVRRVFEVKGRPSGMALPLLVADLEMLERASAGLPAAAYILAARFLPGPLTLVVLKAPWVPEIVTAGQPTVALRIPGHPAPRLLAAGLGAPIVGTSANRSGQPSAVTAGEVRRQLGALVDYVIDGVCSGGVESTIVDLTQRPPRILRAGAIPAERIEEALGPSIGLRACPEPKPRARRGGLAEGTCPAVAR